MLTWRDLPVAAVAPEVLAGLKQGNVVLQAEPGAGKSTGLPLALLNDASILNKIIMLEPRRLAARGVAERLAAQLGEPLGQQVGLRMRGETRVSRLTRLEVVTEGVLTRMLQSDPLLEGIGLVIFDEFHERSLHADLGLTLSLEVQQALRSDLRLMLMSATLDASLTSSLPGDVHHITCSTRQHPVTITWCGESATPLPSRAANTILDALASEIGDVLVFLPGVAEIEKTARLLQPRLPEAVRLHRLHGGVDAAAQRAATAPAVSSERRVILSTSIAETSITIDGVRVVIDSGLERRGRIDSSTGSSRLETVSASQASATQRSGRAGRTSPGACYRLWSEDGHQRRVESWQPEILRADLAPLLVELGQWGVSDPGQLPWPQVPPAAALSRAEDLLMRLGLWNDGHLTDHGRAVSQLPVHPRLGHMLVWAAARGAGKLACRLAVMLEDGNRGSATVDLEQALARPLPKHLQSRVRQLEEKLTLQPATNTVPAAAVLLAQAYPDWIARGRAATGGRAGAGGRPGTGGNAGAQSRFALSCGAGAVLYSDDALAHAEWLSVAQLGGGGHEAQIFAACQLDISELEHFAPELFTSRDYLEWDDRLERVVAEQHTVVGNLVVRSRTLTQVSKTDRARAVLAGISRRGLACLPWTDDCREWQARVQRASALPDHLSQGSWPSVDDGSLLQEIETWLLPWLDGVGSLKALAQIDLYNILNSMLDYPQQRLLDELLPRRFKVPSGSTIGLRYAEAGNPVLSVKLQEMFGCESNPSVAGGHVPLKVELLSPARRPVQVTEDLANFWHNSYPAVKKDMAGRYPKHHWPDDPFTAQPTARAKPRKR